MTEAIRNHFTAQSKTSFITYQVMILKNQTQKNRYLSSTIIHKKIERCREEIINGIHNLGGVDPKHTNRIKIQSADIYLYVSLQCGSNRISLNDLMRPKGNWLMGNEISLKGLK